MTTYFKRIGIPRNARPGFDDILANFQNVFALDY